ncbi:MAG: branched chain amino acid aminotransferase, partial [Micromonosporaceae bacterium]|nr:branched chain amino acid aminotransferase [Micromonosporaceae bacterium]
MSGGDSLAFEISPNPAPVSDVERAALLADPGFGRLFTDHMIVIKYQKDKGWHEARVDPHGPISVSPAMAALHYAQEIFEGLKAYHCADGGVSLFRPDE